MFRRYAFMVRHAHAKRSLLSTSDTAGEIAAAGTKDRSDESTLADRG